MLSLSLSLSLSSLSSSPSPPQHGIAASRAELREQRCAAGAAPCAPHRVDQGLSRRRRRRPLGRQQGGMGDATRALTRSRTRGKAGRGGGISAAPYRARTRTHTHAYAHAHATGAQVRREP